MAAADSWTVRLSAENIRATVSLLIVLSHNERHIDRAVLRLPVKTSSGNFLLKLLHFVYMDGNA